MPDIQAQKRHTFKGHSSGIFCLTAIDDRTFLSAGGDGNVVKWDVEKFSDGQVIAKLDSVIYALLVDKDRLLVAENSKAIHLLDLSSNKVLKSVEVKTPVFEICKVEDQYLVGTGTGELLSFDSELSLKNRIQFSRKSLRSITAQGDHIALGYSDNIIRIVNRNFELVKELAGHTLSVFAMQYHPETEVLISTGRDAHLRIWDQRNDYLPVQDISAHMYAINHIVFDPNARCFATGSMDKTIKIWDGTTFALLKVIDKDRYDGHVNSVNRMLWMEFDNLLVTCSDDRTIAVWDINFDIK